MHTLGHFVQDHSPFSEQSCGPRTTVYIKLANDMTDAQWAQFYGMLRVHQDIHEKMQEVGKPAGGWADDPDKYIIVGSDPPEEE